MTYQLPEPKKLYYRHGEELDCYTAAQMQAAYAAGVAAEREKLNQAIAELHIVYLGHSREAHLAALARIEAASAPRLSDLSALRGIQGVGL